MKLKVFLVSSLLATKAVACSYSPYIPSDAYLYRIMEDISLYDNYSFHSREYLIKGFDYREENLQLWREQTGTKMSDERLIALVYGNHTTTSNSSFNGIDALEYLKIAKNVQKIRKALADPWYFPEDKWVCGQYTYNLEDMVEQCKANARGVLRGRYVLQALRCLNTLRKWYDSIELWEVQRDSLSNDVIRTMAEREVAAAYLHVGKDSVAADIYARVGDIESLRMCKLNRDNEMEYVYEHCPDSPYFPEEIQALLMEIDQNHTGYVYWNDIEWSERDSLAANQFLKLCRRVLYERRVKNPAMWLYATAATLDGLSRPNESMPYIVEGERLAKDEFLRKSFRLLRMHIEAQLHPLDEKYDQRLFRDLQWLTREIDNNMNDAQRTHLSNLSNFNWENNSYYWNDAMRRILISDVCPRLVATGRTTRALQLANFADHYLFNKLRNQPVVYDNWRRTEWDYRSYSSSLFELTDSLSAEQLANYVDWQKRGSGAIDRFLASGSNLNPSYWYDIVGTHYLREHKYKDAERWFSLLPKDYEHNTNIFREDKDYMLRNPFDLSLKDPASNRGRLKTTTDYKLNFAKKMAHYENTMNYAKTATERGEAKVYYGAGIRNQMDYCWALTKYSYSRFEYEDWDGRWVSRESVAYKSVKETSERLIEEGLDEITDSETKAGLLHAMHRNREVIQNYPFTWTAHQIYLHCDTWRDYAYHTAIRRQIH